MSNTFRAIASAVVLALGVSSASADLPTTGLVAHYKFDGNATDSGPFSHDGVASGISFSAGTIGQAAVFHGDSYVLATPALQTSSSFTVSAWVNADSIPTGDAMQIAGERNLSVNGQCTNFAVPYSVSCGNWGLEVYLGRFALDITTTMSGISVQDRLFASELVQPGRNYNVIARYDAKVGAISLWIDGKFASTMTVGHDLVVQPGSTLSIGRNWPEGTGTQYWQGSIDDLRIYNRALDNDEIAAAVVPEPSRWALLLVGLSSTTLLRRTGRTRRLPN